MAVVVLALVLDSMQAATYHLLPQKHSFEGGDSALIL